MDVHPSVPALLELVSTEPSLAPRMLWTHVVLFSGMHRGPLSTSRARSRGVFLAFLHIEALIIVPFSTVHYESLYDGRAIAA